MSIKQIRYAACIIAAISLFCIGCQGKNQKLIVSPEELSQNYESHADEIWDLVAYTNAALNDYCGIQLIIKDSLVTELYVYNFLWMGTKNPVQKDYDNLLHFIGFNMDNINAIVDKLVNSNCRSIEMMKDSGYIKVLYKSDNKCGYYYRLFREEQSVESIKEMLDEEPICLLYSNKVMFEYNPYKRGMDPTFPGGEEYLRNNSFIQN